MNERETRDRRFERATTRVSLALNPGYGGPGHGDVDRLVLSGGSADSTSEAELMARFAVDLGVPRSAMLLEAESRSTRQNAQRVAELLRKHRLGPDVVLVTSALHLPRAMAEFRCAGLAAVDTPAEFEVLGAEREFPAEWIPSLGAIDRSRRALKEWAGALAGGCESVVRR